MGLQSAMASSWVVPRSSPGGRIDAPTRARSMHSPSHAAVPDGRRTAREIAARGGANTSSRPLRTRPLGGHPRTLYALARRSEGARRCVDRLDLESAVRDEGVERLVVMEPSNRL